MNPRRRKAIARAIVSGMSRKNLNVSSFKDFLKKENITVTVEINDEKIVTEEKIIEEEVVEVQTPAALKALYSMKSTKTELLDAAEALGLSAKSNMTKKTILSLIESV